MSFGNKQTGIYNMTGTPKTVEKLAELMAAKAWDESNFCEPGEDWNSQTHKMKDVFRTYFLDGLGALEAVGLVVVPVEATLDMWEAMNVRDEADPPVALWELYDVAVAARDIQVKT